jgi:uncharacterized protein YbjT (DUF2867 family)
MKIVVIGGTGLIGAKVVAKLRSSGGDGFDAARSTGVDVVTGAGLDQALQGADAVIDASNSGYSDAVEMQAFFQAAGANLLAAERQALVPHHVALSAVGTDQLNSGYFAAKMTQEDQVIASHIPYTILRATPFFEYIYNIVDQGGDGDTLRLPPVPIQPVAADDVARALVRIAVAGPTDAIFEIAGPDTFLLPTLAEEILTANEDCRTVVADPDALYFGAHMAGVSLAGQHHPRFAPTSFDDWLRRSLLAA